MTAANGSTKVIAREEVEVLIPPAHGIIHGTVKAKARAKARKAKAFLQSTIPITRGTRVKAKVVVPKVVKEKEKVKTLKVEVEASSKNRFGKKRK